MTSLVEDFAQAAREKIAQIRTEQAANIVNHGVSLIEACDRPDLFAFPLWPKQRELLAQFETGPRTHILAIGRRASKTTMMALVGLWCCLLRPELRTHLRPGELGYAVGVATKLNQAKLMIDAARSIVTASPLLAQELVSSTAHELRFRNNTAFTAFPCSSAGGRGWPVFALLMDEFAHFYDTDGQSAAERVWQALSPSTLQFGDQARIIVGSTPWGSTGLFADLFERAGDGQLGKAMAHHASSIEVNPTLSADDLANERIAMSEEEYASEYLAEFVSVGGAFLSREDLDVAVSEDREQLPPEAARGWVAGLDPAFSRDPFALTLVGQDAARKTLVLGRCQRWIPQQVGDTETFEDQRGLQDHILSEVIDICRSYRARVFTDQFMAPAVKDRLTKAGLHVEVATMTAASKTDAFVELRARLAARELELYRDQQLLDELRRLRSRFTAGRSAVLNPRVGDSHGDMAQALALAVWGQRQWSISASPMRVRKPSRQNTDLMRAWQEHRGDVQTVI